MNPGAVGQGPGGALDHPRRGGARRAAAGRHHRRGHGRQHRHRAGAGRRGDGLPHGDRHPRHPEPGEEGRDPRRRAPSSSRCRRCPTATRTTTCATRAGSPRSWPRPSRTARSGPTSSTTSPTGRRMSRAPRPEIWEQTGGRIDGFICAVGSGGTLAGVAEGLRAREARRQDRPRRSRRRGALALLHPRRAEGRGRLDHRGHRPGPDHRQPRGPGGRHALPHPRQRGAADRLRPDRARGPLPGRLDRHQRRRRDPHGARPGPGPHDRHRSSATAARATSRSCSTRRSCATRACRCRAGSRRDAGACPMPSWPERRAAAALGRLIAARCCWSALAVAALAQDAAEVDAGRAKQWDALATEAEAMVADPDAATETLEELRESWLPSAARRSPPSRSASRRSTSSTSGCRRSARRRPRAPTRPRR